MQSPHIDHIGIIVADLDRATAMFQRLFGRPPVSTRDMSEVGIRIAKFQAENIAIELIEYTAEGPSFAREVMGDALGINHIAARVGDMDAAMEQYAAAGLKAQPGFPRPGADGQVTFFEKEEATGLLFEICQHE